MKILITSDTYENQVCGVSSSIATLKDELINRGHDVRVLLLSNNRKSKIKNNDYCIGSFPLYLIDFRQSIKYHDKIINEIVSWNPDIIHIQTEWFAGDVGRKIAKKCNCPYINTFHTLWDEFTMGLIPIKKVRKLNAKRLVKKTYKNSSAIIVPSDKMLDYLKKVNIDLPTYIVPTGVDIDKFNQKLSTIEEDKIKSDLGLDKNSKVLMFIGRVAKEKNLEELIDFLQDLVSKNENIVLVIGGDGPDMGHLKNRVKHLNMEEHVRFAGVIPPEDTYKYYNIGDIFVSSSTCETQGITYMEALASSLPLVCRYDKSLDHVIENGVDGFTYTSKDEYVNSILRILGDEDYHAQLRSNAFKSSLKFSKEKFGRDIEKVYFNAVNNGLK